MFEVTCITKNYYKYKTELVSKFSPLKDTVKIYKVS